MIGGVGIGPCLSCRLHHPLNLSPRIIDGNHLAATERRLQVLRSIGGAPLAPLPGLALVVYDRELGLVSNAYLQEDAYVQERSLVLETLGDVAKGELWIADRNFCTTVVLFQIHVSQVEIGMQKGPTSGR